MYISIDLGGTGTRIIASTDLSTEGIIEEVKYDTPQDFEPAFDKIVSSIKVVLKNESIDAIAVALAGIVNEERSELIVAANIPDYANKNLKAKLEKDFNCKVYLENDTVCAALAELEFGEAKDINSISYITVSTGIGGAFITKEDGLKIFEAQVGHQMIGLHGKQCACDQRGCIETYAGGKSLSERFLRDASNIDDLRIWEDTVEYLAIACTNFLNLFLPDVLVLGGGMIQNNEYVKNKIEKEIRNQMRISEVPPILISNFVDEVGVYGGLALIKNSI
ncbi:MAG: ROK family protein [Candidatus Dojkabacteria bacterium]|nr:ROK family protein [Candidatus Dojkabacteria bacterium]MDQ7020543.1 ROK family protein [Candidatus Dojkabacteria bacterium]